MLHWPWSWLLPRIHPDSLQPSCAKRIQERTEEKEKATERVEERK